MEYNHVSDKDINSWVLETLCIWFKHIDAITNSMNMIFKENNGNAFIMKCYADYEFWYDV